MEVGFVSNGTAMMLAAAVGLFGVLAHAESPSAAKTTWDGVYTEAQAGRGMQIITAQCTTCHAENLQGGPGVPTVVGPAFTFKWNGKSLRDLLELIRSTMPPGQAGSLGEQEYADVIAAILQHNRFPASAETELSGDAGALADIQIRRMRP
jgi:mono/diheme cytochrome c family protein